MADATQLERVIRSEALLAEAEQLADLGSWEFDLATGLITRSANLCRMLGAEPSAKSIPEDSYWNLLAPEDHELVRSTISHAMTTGNSYEYQAGLILPGSRKRTFLVRGKPIFDSSSHVIKRLGVALDVTERKDAEERLRRSEALLDQAEQLANVGGWELDLKEQTITWSAHLYRMLGFEPEPGPVPHAQAMERIHPDDLERALRDETELCTGGPELDNEIRFVTASGRIRTFHTRAVSVADASGKLVRVRGMSQDISNQLQTERDLRRLSQELMLARDDERRRIARGLHESVGQTLAGLKMSLGRVRETLPDSKTRAYEFLESAIQLADGAVREVRTISYLMHPPMLDEAGLASALRWYAHGFGERSGIKLKLEVSEDLERQTQEVETTIFRIVQEALTNVHRHSGTRAATVRLACDNGYVTVEVRDEGCGIPFNGFSNRSRGMMGVGIQGIRERVKQLKGAFEIETAAGKGTTIRVIVPFASAKPWEKRADTNKDRKPGPHPSLQARRASGGSR